MNVIVIGSGAREHALCRILDKSYLCEKVFCFPGNYGISQIAECRNISTKEDIIRECIKINPDLIVVGPENYLSENIAGELRNNGLNVFGPDSKGAKLESSKEFMKEFCQSHDIATAKSQTFVDFEKAKNYLMSFNGPIVVKYDGLAAGKGVFVCTDTNEAIEACKRVFINKEFNQENNKVVIEDFIEGRELSFFTITDGEDYLNFGSAQDYKRIGDNDTGPNTGGMGTISPAPILEEELNKIIQEEIVKKTINGLKHDNITFQGVIFFGIIVNEYNQPYLLEYNTRFGDPEIQSISLRVKSDFLSLLHSTATKNLKYAKIEFYENKNRNEITEFIDRNNKVRKARLLTWIPGRIWGSVNPQSDKLRFILGEKSGIMTSLLNGFEHNMSERKFAFSYTHLRAHETRGNLVCRLLL